MKRVPLKTRVAGRQTSSQGWRKTVAKY
jgi:hypothetical protein